MDIKQLELQFASRLRDAIQQSRELGYHPTRFEQMLSEIGARALAKKLVISGELQDGLRTIAKLGRKDLAMEAIMLEPEFHPLFSAGERQAAKWRLEQVS